MIQDVRLQIREFAAPVAQKLGIGKISDFADVILLSFVFFSTVHNSLAPAVSGVLFPVSYGKAGKRARNNWDIHVTSLVHAIIIIFLAGRCLNLSSLDQNRAFGWHEDAGFVIAIATGYFIWDTLESIIHFSDIGFVLHGISCLLIYGLSFTPFVPYYGVRFLFWELSTVFLDIHWFLDKTGKTGSTLQLVNGIALITTFFSVRCVWGAMMSYDFFVTLNSVYDQVLTPYLIIYGGGNVLLQVLNWFWFTKMITALTKRFQVKPDGHKVVNGKVKL
ncbi:TLC domain-containing protein [Suillus clintonianus]|uniref:TLC domain-containing protein n=1 Tax=Suillus clintonianus TaxID=1904413 RepID=UPI001B8860BD|nr:TLC domain-containing protein [Suillus clintonianus]KAG2157463.1 TLC domain-containing protein [Suillus clintonianus]